MPNDSGSDVIVGIVKLAFWVLILLIGVGLGAGWVLGHIHPFG